MSDTVDKEAGIGAVEALLLLVIVGLIGFVSWYVYHSSKTTNKLNAASQEAHPSSAHKSTVPLTQTYKDTAGYYTMKYPADWTSLNASHQTVLDPQGNQVEESGLKLMPAALKDQFATLQLGFFLAQPVGRYEGTPQEARAKENAIEQQAGAHTETQQKDLKISGYDVHYGVRNYANSTNGYSYTLADYSFYYKGAVLDIASIPSVTKPDGTALTNIPPYQETMKAILNSIHFIPTSISPYAPVQPQTGG